MKQAATRQDVVAWQEAVISPEINNYRITEVLANDGDTVQRGDVLARIAEFSPVPVAAYQVSGEYAMIRAAAERGWLDERAAALESLLAIRRAGADLIITYFAEDAARWLAEGA